NKADVILESDYFSYTISSGGKNLRFIDKTSATDYLYNDTVSYCASIILNGKVQNVQKASLTNGLLSLDFGTSGVKAKIS
ncbi:hypothetical protein, partial [Campylobacter jejuni]|uniref:hypothetical protein n=1 Tax=Campylobacter jejuni TaxID=197 RepID=UPI0028F19254